MSFPHHHKPVVSVTLWESRGQPDEDILRARLLETGYHVLKWTSEPGQVYIPHAHIYPELLWLLAGSITTCLPAENRLLELFAGDRIEVPAGTLHGVLAGPDGAVYLMATRCLTGDVYPDQPADAKRNGGGSQSE